jgi:hypothetical protein
VELRWRLSRSGGPTVASDGSGSRWCVRVSIAVSSRLPLRRFALGNARTCLTLGACRLSCSCWAQVQDAYESPMLPVICWVWQVLCQCWVAWIVGLTCRCCRCAPDVGNWMPQPLACAASCTAYAETAEERRCCALLIPAWTCCVLLGQWHGHVDYWALSRSRQPDLHGRENVTALFGVFLLTYEHQPLHRTFICACSVMPYI